MNLNTPWRAEESDGWRVLLDASGAVVCTGLDDDIAAEIVRRVNAFDRLVAACELVLSRFMPNEQQRAVIAKHSPELLAVYDHVGDTVRAALAVELL